MLIVNYSKEGVTDYQGCKLSDLKKIKFRGIKILLPVFADKTSDINIRGGWLGISKIDFMELLGNRDWFFDACVNERGLTLFVDRVYIEIQSEESKVFQV